MNNSHLIRNLGPNLLQDHSLRHHNLVWKNLSHSVAFWMTVLGLLSCIGYGIAHAETTNADPMVVKIYPDETKLLLRSSEAQKTADKGENFGGAPKFFTYHPSK